jgi:GT2 family glycosyltransferase
MSGVVISGMHHSGTSVVTGILASSGWCPGESLIPKDGRLQKEFWEDQEFVKINQEFLQQPDFSLEDPSDWGIYGTSLKEIQVESNSISLAKKYVSERSIKSQYWIAKDPRSSLTLPIWGQIPSLKFLMIYRSPWDVVESLMRFGAPFSGRANWALAVWKAYNLKLLEMKEILGDRCLLVSSESVLHNPHHFYDVYSKWVGCAIGEIKPKQVINPQLFSSRQEGSEISTIFRSLYPQESTVLENLNSEAAIPNLSFSQTSSRLIHGGNSNTTKAVQVIIPCKNDGQFLYEALASVEVAALSSVLPVELTVVDSCSDEENTLQIFNRLRDSGYQVIQSKKPGLPVARNRAIKESKAEIVLPLDSDNRLLPAMLMNSHHIISEEADVVYGQWIRFGLDNAIHSPPQQIDWNSLVPHNTLDNCALVSRQMLLQLKGWDRSLVYGLEDWDLWIRAISRRARFRYVPEPFFHYFVRPNSMTWLAAQDEEKSKKSFIQVAKKHMKQARKVGADTRIWENQFLH